MNTLRRQILLNSYKFLDVSIMVAAFSFATIVTHFHGNNITATKFIHQRVEIHNFVIFLGFVLIWYLIFSSLKLYSSKRLSSKISEITDIFKATFLGTLILLVGSFVLNIEMVTFIFLLVFLGAVSFLTVFCRLILRAFLGVLRKHGRNLREILIAGTNERAIKFAHNIEAKPELGYHILGFVDEEWSGIEEFQKSRYPLVTDFKNFLPYIREHVVDEVAINLPMKSYYEYAAEIAAICEEQGIIVRQFSNIFNLENGYSHFEIIDDSSWLTISNGAMKGWLLELKRVIDLIISAFLLIISLPSCIIISIIIKITTKGPVFFIQERVGHNKRIFKMYKFRTMIVDAEKKQDEMEHLNVAGGPVFKIINDPRVTPFGKILRKTSIDELPQLVNILKGEMSLIGPRPLPVRDYNGFDKDWHRRRFSVRPGVTCLWQINGRSDLPFEKWMELDMEYIDNWSPWIDFKILVNTLPVVFKGSGAF